MGNEPERFVEYRVRFKMNNGVQPDRDTAEWMLDRALQHYFDCDPKDQNYELYGVYEMPKTLTLQGCQLLQLPELSEREKFAAEEYKKALAMWTEPMVPEIEKKED